MNRSASIQRRIRHSGAWGFPGRLICRMRSVCRCIFSYDLKRRKEVFIVAQSSGSPILYERGLLIEFSRQKMEGRSAEYYFFDYNQKNRFVNMEFPHMHTFYEMMILLSEKANHYLAGRKYILSQNDIILLPPKILHQSEYISESPSRRIIIEFVWPVDAMSTEAVSMLSSLFDVSKPVLRFPRELQKEIFRPLNKIEQIGETKDAMSELLVQTYFLEFMCGLYLHRGQNEYIAKEENSPVEKIYQAANYIQVHYMEKISLSVLAEHFYLSPCYLSHRFREITGYTVSDYIEQTRIKNAKYILINTDTHISDASEMVGFSSFSQFSRSFRRFVGMTPTAYRESALTQRNRTLPHSRI